MSAPQECDEVVLALDQGTTNTKALLVARSGSAVFATSSPLVLIHSRSDRVEQSAEAIWQSVKEVISRCLDYAAQSSCRVSGIAISNQRETAVAWRRGTGEPVAPAISWQCRRSAAICRDLAPSAALIRRKTGLPLDPLVSASKWLWMLENAELGPTLRSLAGSGELCFGTVDSWLIAKLTGGAVHATDSSNASRTALFNLETLQWDDELLALFGVPRSALPQVLPSAGAFGACTAIAGLAGVPIVTALGDSHAALAAQSCGCQGMVKATYGTGSSLMTLSEDLPSEVRALARTVAWATADKTLYALEGNIAMTGSAVQWVGEFLKLPRPAEDAIELSASVENASGVFFVPAMAGLGAPYWDTEARGSIYGLGRSHHAAHLARAALDAIAFQVADVFDAMETATQSTIAELRADGGATRNPKLMQFQADILDRIVLRSTMEELSAMGAAWLAGVSLGWWDSLAQAKQTAAPAESIHPAMSISERESLRAGWKRAVQSTLSREAA